LPRPGRGATGKSPRSPVRPQFHGSVNFPHPEFCRRCHKTISPPASRQRAATTVRASVSGPLGPRQEKFPFSFPWSRISDNLQEYSSTPFRAGQHPHKRQCRPPPVDHFFGLLPGFSRFRKWRSILDGLLLWSRETQKKSGCVVGTVLRAKAGFQTKRPRTGNQYRLSAIFFSPHWLNQLRFLIGHNDETGQEQRPVPTN